MTLPSGASRTQTFRILSLDGGGIMGAFPASVLATFERSTGKRIVDHFDLITGTSTGGIIAIGLALGASAEEICRFYRNEGLAIFPKRVGFRKYLGRVKNFLRPKYSNEALRATIQKVVGDRPLGQAKTRLVVPSYDVNTGKVYVFKTPHHTGYLNHADLPAVDAALATSAAPTYFPAHTIPGRGTFVDGGLWANCPAMVGLVEALGFLDKAPEQVRLLSISTTSYPYRIGNPDRPRGLIGWAPQLIDTFMFGQAQSSVNMAVCLLRRGQFHRIDYLVPPKTFQMDNVHCVEQLIGMGRQIAELNENMQVVSREFLNGQTVEPFEAGGRP
ncbi:MAG: CBASS cGAMP-activated phospholipase [Isosphaeraceae bacterium]|nr:CBASS cGAMP-activated phospholipase [Isosphaeraceae bacterium]